MRPRRRRLLAALLTSVALAASAAGVVAERPTPGLRQPAQDAGASPGPGGRALVQDGSQLTIYLLTMGPGDAVWERFGHDAIWVHDPVAGTDIAYNWGMFDFNAPHFLGNFIRGEMMYWMEGFDAQRVVDVYVQENRSVWAQELNLTPAQRLAMKRFLEWNARPENRFYRYDYYLDNCTTRARDAIDRVIGGRLRAATLGTPSGSTFRSHTRILTEAEPFIYTGIELGLGEPVDREIPVWEEMFLPMQLMRHLRGITVPAPDGSSVPLVKREWTVFRATRADLPDAPPTWWPLYLLIGVLTGGVLAGLGAASRRGRGWRVTFGLAGTLWSAFIGLFSLVLVFLWGFTGHWAAYRNENLLQFDPVSLALPVLLPLLLLGRARRWAVGAAAVVAGLALAGFLMQALPAADQVNGEIIALALPAHIGLLLGVLAARRGDPRGSAQTRREEGAR